MKTPRHYFALLISQRGEMYAHGRSDYAQPGPGYLGETHWPVTGEFSPQPVLARGYLPGVATTGTQFSVTAAPVPAGGFSRTVKLGG